MTNEITEELLEKIRKFPERYRVIEQNPLEHYLDIRGDEVRFEPIVFKKDLANNPQNKHMVILDTKQLVSKQVTKLSNLHLLQLHTMLRIIV